MLFISISSNNKPTSENPLSMAKLNFESRKLKSFLDFLLKSAPGDNVYT